MAEEKIPEPSPSAEQAPEYGEVLASWEFYEHDRYARGVWWYVIAALGVIALLWYAYYEQNFLLAVIVILSIIIFALSELRGPAIHSFGITEAGLVAGPQFFPYDSLQNFFIIYQPPEVKMLYFDPKSIARPHIGIPLGDQDPNAIREILLNYLPEDIDKEEEPTSDFFGRLLKF